MHSISLFGDALVASRVLMGDSLGFHIIFVLFSLTLPILVCWFEWLGIRKKDPKYTATAKLWSKVMAVLVITGVISGTIIALQMSLVWPGILQFGGKVIGLPFLFETYAFLIEAVFLALYMVTWNNKRVSPYLHLTFGLFIVFGATLSAFAITAINSWMNYPTGFDYVNGQVTNIHVWSAIFSRTAFIEFSHSMLAYYMTASLIIAGLYAFKLLRHRSKDRAQKQYAHDWAILNNLVVFAIVAFLLLFVTADLTGKYLAKYEPVKLAAIELNYNTQGNVPLIIGGVASGTDGISGPHFEIPGALSFLAGSSTNTVVLGLNDFNASDRPPLYVHTLFDIKMTAMNILVAILGLYVLVRWFKPKWLNNAWALIAVGFVGYFALLSVELGWMLTEIGRQPWAVRGYVTTTEALTKTHDITSFGYFFPLSYVVLFAVTFLALVKLVKSERKA